MTNIPPNADADGALGFVRPLQFGRDDKYARSHAQMRPVSLTHQCRSGPAVRAVVGACLPSRSQVTAAASWRPQQRRNRLTRPPNMESLINMMSLECLGA